MLLGAEKVVPIARLGMQPQSIPYLRSFLGFFSPAKNLHFFTSWQAIAPDRLAMQRWLWTASVL
jgi:hypothetical protein